MTEDTFNRRAFLAALATVAGPADAAATPSPRIDGDHWTPARNPATDEIPDAEWEALPANTPLLVPSAGTLADHMAQPYYPTATGAPPTLMDSWSGAAFNHVDDAMVFAGGGHGNSSACENAIYSLYMRRMRIERTVDRSAYDAALRPAVAGDYTSFVRNNPRMPKPGVPGPGDWFDGSGNMILADGRPGTWHWYDGLAWLSGEVGRSLGLETSTKGWLFMASHARALINLDSGEPTQMHFHTKSQWDTTYCAHFLDTQAAGKVQLVGFRGGYAMERFALDEQEMTEWQAATYHGSGRPIAADPSKPSLGKRLPALQSSAARPFVYNFSAICHLRERREYVALHGNQMAMRVRYGAALDSVAAGRFVSWPPGGMDKHMDVITLRSSNGSDHLDFSSANFHGHTGQKLQRCGAAYDHRSGSIWVVPNTLEPTLGIYCITGIETDTWTVKKVDRRMLAAASNGTYGRWRLMRRGSALIGVRWVRRAFAPEVIRLDANA